MTLDDLLKIAARKPRVEAVDVGGQELHLRGLSAGDLHELHGLVNGDEALSLQLLIVAKAVCTPDGEPLFGDAEAGAKKLTGLPGLLLDRLYRAVDRLSDVEPGGTGELLGNSQGGTGDSLNGSP